MMAEFLRKDKLRFKYTPKVRRKREGRQIEIPYHVIIITMAGNEPKICKLYVRNRVIELFYESNGNQTFVHVYYKVLKLLKTRLI